MLTLVHNDNSGEILTLTTNRDLTLQMMNDAKIRQEELKNHKVELTTDLKKLKVLYVHYCSFDFGQKIQSLEHTIREQKKSLDKMNIELVSERQKLQRRSILDAKAYGKTLPVKDVALYESTLTHTLSKNIDGLFQEIGIHEEELRKLDWDKNVFLNSYGEKIKQNADSMSKCDSELNEINKSFEHLTESLEQIKYHLKRESARKKYERYVAININFVENKDYESNEDESDDSDDEGYKSEDDEDNEDIKVGEDEQKYLSAMSLDELFSKCNKYHQKMLLRYGNTSDGKLRKKIKKQAMECHYGEHCVEDSDCSHMCECRCHAKDYDCDDCRNCSYPCECLCHQFKDDMRGHAASTCKKSCDYDTVCTGIWTKSDMICDCGIKWEWCADNFDPTDIIKFNIWSREPFGEPRIAKS